MSDYQGNIIVKNPATPTGPAENGSAPGIWKLSEALAFKRQGIWPTQGVSAGDPYFSYVSMLLSTTSLGNANNNLFVDSSGTFTPLSRTGNATQGSATPYSANWSNYFDGSSTLTFSSISLAGDFTIEAWVYYTSTSGNPTFVGANPPNNQALRRLSGKHYFYFQGPSITGTIDIPTNQWVHLAVTRSSNTVRIFTNGVLDGSASISGTFSVFCIGGVDTGTDRLTGYGSNVRIVNGTAVYTSTFTPPTSPLTAISGTVLLTCQSNRFRDASASPYTLTVNGSPRVTDFAPFSPGSPGITYNQSDITNWSGYFDGSGDYLTTPSNAAFDFGTGDFTIEGWLWLASTASVVTIVTNYAGPSAGWSLQYRSDIGGFRFGWGDPALLDYVASIPTNTWMHLAVTRSGTSLRMFLNGAQVASTTNSTSLTGGSTVSVGALNAGGYVQNYNGYISNLRIVKGTAVYTGAFTPPTTNLTAISGTSLLTLQNAAFTDNSTNNFVITPNGNVTVTGNSPVNTVGYWSNYFDGTAGNYLSAPNNAAFQFGTGDVTIESWIYITGDSVASPDGNRHATICAGIGPTGISNDFWFYVKGNSTTTGTGLVLRTYNSGSEVAVFNTTYSFSKNTWYHVALSRSGNNMYLFIDGALHASTTYTGAITVGSNPLNIAYAQTGGINYNAPFFGYLSNLRIVKGSAVYTSAFTVPTSPLTAISGTSILTCQNGRFVDNSTNAFAITQTGSISAQSFDPFYTSTIASNGGSMYFDGSGDNVSFLSGDKVQFGTGDFTVEFWVYPQNAASTSYYFVDGRNTGQTGTWAFYRNGSNQIEWYNGTSGFGASNVVANAWNHVVYCRSGTTGRTFLNGAVVGTFTDSTNYSLAPTRSYIGSMYTGNEVLNGYMSGLRITKSALYTAAFTPPTTPATPSASTLLLVNGMNAGIYDATAINDMETVGNAQVRYPSPFAPADYYAGYFDGASDWVATPSNAAFGFGTGDFTIECWMYPTSTKANMRLWQFSTDSDNIDISPGGSTGALNYYNGSTSTSTAAGVINFNAWSHVACVRSSGTVRVYLNGILQITQASTPNTSTRTLYIGGQASTWFEGSISNFRVVKGTAVYTSNFTPPTAPLTAIANTQLLTCQNKTFIDNSANAFTLTVNGNAVAGAIGPFPGTGGTSVYFDGSGDWLDLQQNSPVNWLGTGDYTIEFWVYGNSWSTLPVLLEYGRNSTGSTPGLEFYVSTSGGKLDIYGGSTTGTLLASYSSLSTTTWTHVALTRASGSTRLFINGTQSGATASDTTNYNQAYIRIGAFVNGSNSLNGYIDDLRVTKGYARYTTNFTPPTQPFVTY